MAVKFEFTLEDADAENLFECINTRILMSSNQFAKAIVQKDEQLQAVYRNDVKYLQGPKAKLLNTRVGE
mgnify:CR=1 FL=1